MRPPWSKDPIGLWFTMVEVEINSHCNRRCPYCPNSVLPTPGARKLMESVILGRLFGELKRIRFAGRIAYHFYGEPLLHPDLLDIISMARRRLPNMRQVLYTNGDLLTDEMYERLLACGVARLIVTSHDRRPVSERPNQVVLFPDDLTITNRGGTVSYGEDCVLSAPLDAPCFAPSSMLMVEVTGSVLLCYEDARRSQVMGNLMQAPIDDIWFSSRFEEVRQRLGKGDRRVTAVCSVCNNVSHPNGETYDYRP